MNDSLKNQVAIISGASQGIGETLARHLARAGVNLVLCARSIDKLEALAEELTQKHPDLKILSFPCNVQNHLDVQSVVDETLAAFDRIDILINNAGVAPHTGLLQEISIQDIDRTIDTNLKGAIYFMRAVLGPMVHRQGGTIININSIAGKTAFPYWSVYAASKFGLHAITEAVAEEQRRNNIKVIGIYPGAVDTPIWNGLTHEQPDRAGMLDADTVAETVLYILSQPSKVFISDVTLAPLQPAL